MCSSDLARLAELVDDATRAFDDFDYARALERTETFFWSFTDDQLHFNASHKNQLNWLPWDQVQTVTGNYSGRIYAMDQTLVTGRKYALRIDVNASLGGKSGLSYWVEHRSRYTSNSYLANGALIFTSDQTPDQNGTDGSLQLLDMNPASGGTAMSFTATGAVIVFTLHTVG